LAKMIEYLLDGPCYGVYHGVCEGAGSRYDVARHLISSLGKDKEVTLREVDSRHFSETYFAPRPTSERLVDTRLKAVGADIARDWQECLREYLARFAWNLGDLNTSGMERSFYRNYFTIEKSHWLMVFRRRLVMEMINRYATKSPK